MDDDEDTLRAEDEVGLGVDSSGPVVSDAEAGCRIGNRDG